MRLKKKEAEGRLTHNEFTVKVIEAEEAASRSLRHVRETLDALLRNHETAVRYVQRLYGLVSKRHEEAATFGDPAEATILKQSESACKEIGVLLDSGHIDLQTIREPRAFLLKLHELLQKHENAGTTTKVAVLARRASP